MLKPSCAPALWLARLPAAFGRLCVETNVAQLDGVIDVYQPPSGGCVLKLVHGFAHTRARVQPPSGGCVLKQGLGGRFLAAGSQPPSGGCVLKPHQQSVDYCHAFPAAFGRLCVETVWMIDTGALDAQPPSGGCVLKHGRGKTFTPSPNQPPSGGCVLKLTRRRKNDRFYRPSRLRAAVC